MTGLVQECHHVYLLRAIGSTNVKTCFHDPTGHPILLRIVCFINHMKSFHKVEKGLMDPLLDTFS